MLTRWHGLAAALAALAALAPAGAQTIDITALSRRAGPDREARLLEGARKERASSWLAVWEREIGFGSNRAQPIKANKSSAAQNRAFINHG